MSYGRRLPDRAGPTPTGALFYSPHPKFMASLVILSWRSQSEFSFQDGDRSKGGRKVSWELSGPKRGKESLEVVISSPSPLLQEEVEEFCILDWTKLTPKAKLLQGKGPRRPLYQLPSLSVLDISKPSG